MPISTLQFDRSEQTAIAITGIWAYSNGFEIFVTCLIRPDAPRLRRRAGAPVHRRACSRSGSPLVRPGESGGRYVCELLASLPDSSA